MGIQDLAIRFSESEGYEGFSFDVQLIPGEAEVLQVVVGEFSEVPVYVSTTDTQVLCISYLWGEDEVRPEKRNEMLEAMVEMNIPMPLSAFSKIGDRYVIFGALMASSGFDDIAHEVIMLAENSIEALTAMEEYLK